jgi:hypothetical protein
MSVLMSVLTVSLIGAGAAQAQTQTPAAPPSVSAQASQTVTAWNSCQSRATAQNLSGRRSWQFLYDCMTKS